FLRGVLSSAGEVDVCRLNRTEDCTTFQIMGAEAIENLSNSPLLSSQPVLESIFFHGVAVCEADSDRLYYQTVAALAHDEHEVHFLHAHNKQTLKDVVKLLRDASIPCAAIADIDLLNSNADLSALVESFGHSPPPSEVINDRNAVAAAIEGRTDDEILEALGDGAKEFLDQLGNGEHSLSGARSALRRLDASSSRWNVIKLRGVDALDEPIKSQAARLIDRLKSIGIFIVPVGELESWADVGTRRKKAWIVLALQQLSAEGTPNGVKEFVEAVIRHAKRESDEREDRAGAA
ncbi:MAG: TOPRIM nucleotidyl transferase/hydrolase domain-containing protein, partial [Pseudomonadota bacterium]